MIKFTTDNGVISCVAEIKNRYGVYLDNFALKDLAKGSASRRDRFIKALHFRGTLLFSEANALEIAGPQGDSALAIRSFLDSIDHYWVPLRMDSWEIVAREEAGLSTGAPISEQFLGGFFQERTAELSQLDGVLLDLSAVNFFKLSAVLNWMQKDRDYYRTFGPNIDGHLQDLLRLCRAEYEKNPLYLDLRWPPVFFDDNKPATFVMNHLIRLLVHEAKSYQFKKNDGLDFCHAVVASAYGSLVTLDSQWKRRVESIPKPNRLAKIYYGPELDQFVNDMETLVAA